MAKSKVTFRLKGGQGGVIVNADDVEKFLETGNNKELYVRESTDERKANQRAADAKAQAPSEDKAVAAPNRQRG